MDWNFIIFTLIKIVCVIGAVLTMFAYSVLAERKISAFIQGRVGPNRVALPLIGSVPVVGPFLTRIGFWQPIADGLKAFLKEDFTPSYVRKAYFWLAPAIMLAPSFLIVAVIPFGSTLGKQRMVIADLDVGILYTFGIVSLGVYGIVLAGYAANSKYPFLGGIRSSAQMISYEIAMGLSVIPLFLIVGELNLSKVVIYQAGGWSQPIAGLDQPATTIPFGLLHIGIFLAKTCFVEFMIIWVRWMWPRFRYDQLMDLGWRRFIPLALANIVVTAGVLWWRSA